MKIILIIAMLFVSVSASCQEYDSWKIYHNRKEVSRFNDRDDNPEERKVVLLNRFLEGPGFLIFEFRPATGQSDWIRTIAFYDKDDKLIREYKNTLFLRLHNSEVAAFLENRPLVKVYSWAVPKDPQLAATVKVRRILLCTLYSR